MITRLSRFERYAFQQNLIGIEEAAKNSNPATEDAEYLCSLLHAMICERLQQAKVATSEIFPMEEPRALFDLVIGVKSWPAQLEVVLGLNRNGAGIHRWELGDPPLKAERTVTNFPVSPEEFMNPGRTPKSNTRNRAASSTQWLARGRQRSTK